jgi:cholesterol transport system auxiliary component
MTGRPSRIARRCAAGILALALVGCSSLFVSTPPGKLFRLTPVGNFPATLPRVSVQLLIDQPQAPAGIDTSRIALSKTRFSLDYFADSEWTDRVPDLIQNLLLASFENSNAITAVDRNSGGLRADFILRTEIRHFEAVYETPNGPPQALVEIIAALTAVPGRKIIAERRFEQRTPAAANDLPSIVAAFDAATDTVLQEIVDWTLRNPALSRAQRPLI